MSARVLHSGTHRHTPSFTAPSVKCVSQSGGPPYALRPTTVSSTALECAAYLITRKLHAAFSNSQHHLLTKTIRVQSGISSNNTAFEAAAVQNPSRTRQRQAARKIAQPATPETDSPRSADEPHRSEQHPGETERQPQPQPQPEPQQLGRRQRPHGAQRPTTEMAEVVILPENVPAVTPGEPGQAVLEATADWVKAGMPPASAADMAGGPSVPRPQQTRTRPALPEETAPISDRTGCYPVPQAGNAAPMSPTRMNVSSGAGRRRTALRPVLPEIPESAAGRTSQGGGAEAAISTKLTGAAYRAAAGPSASTNRAAAGPGPSASTNRAAAGPGPSASTNRAAAGQGPSASTDRAVAGPGPSAVAAPPVFVFWDLDNKYPETLDHRALVGRMRGILRKHGKVVEIRAYGNHRTLKFVPELWQEAMTRGMKHPLVPGGPEPPQLCCPLCHRPFPEEAKLRSHFRQQHLREHQKRLTQHQPAAKRAKYVQSRLFERTEAAARRVLVNKRGYDLEGILISLGVKVRAVPMGKGKADARLQREAMALIKERECHGAAAPAGPGPAPAAPGPVLALVSDDHGFEALLKLAATVGWTTVVLSNTNFKNAGARQPWVEVLGAPGEPMTDQPPQAALKTSAENVEDAAGAPLL